MSNFVKISPKTICLKNFEIPPKIKILIFWKKSNPVSRWHTKACAHCLDFQYNNFSLCFLYCQKTTFVCEFQHTPLWKIIFFLNASHFLWIWDFVDINLTHLGTRIKCCTIHAYLKKLFFGPSKFYYPPLAQGKKTFLSTLNVMILQTVRNKCARFGGHVNIEVSYKILWLDVLKETPSLQNRPCFE